MRTVAIGDTGISTTELGFGCAGLYRTGDASTRRATLEKAFEGGIRHFDVAPMYGLGVAERELGAFVRGCRNEVTISTKFGVGMTGLGRMAGALQGPIRAALAKSRAVSHSVERSGAGPGIGAVGRILYTASGYDRVTAERSLDASLRALATDHVDFLFLHDPPMAFLAEADDVFEHLAAERERGRIGAWGIASDLYPVDLAMCRRLSGLGLGCIQVRDHVFETPRDWDLNGAVGMFTFGAISGALPLLADYLEARPGPGDHRHEIDQAVLPAVLLRESVRRNPVGVSIFSTSKPSRVKEMCELFLCDDGESQTESMLLSKIVESVSASSSTARGRT